MTSEWRFLMLSSGPMTLALPRVLTRQRYSTRVVSLPRSRSREVIKYATFSEGPHRGPPALAPGPRLRPPVPYRLTVPMPPRA